MIRIVLVGVLLLIGVGCRTQHKIDMTTEVKPIHITMDINLKVDRELDDFFGDIDQAATEQIATEEVTIEETATEE